MPTSGSTGFDTAAHRGEIDLHRLHGDHSAVNARIDFLPFPRLLTRVERREDARHQHHGAGMIGY